MRHIVIGRGVQSALELSDAGISPQLLEQADHVITIDRDGRAHERACSPVEVLYVDVDPADAVLLECMERVKAEYERMNPEEFHLSHAAAGLWLFYWTTADQRPVLELAREGRVQELRAAAADYVESGFGLRGPRSEALAQAP